MTTLSIPYQITQSKAARLKDEFIYAFEHTDSADYKNYVLNLATGGMGLVTKRAKNIGSLADRIYSGGRTGLASLSEAYREKRLRRFVGETLNSSKLAAGQKINAVYTLAGEFSNGFREDPKTESAKLAAFVFGLLTTSGGLDGDGGLPDEDWQLFDEHRSIWTHSVTLGIGLELLVLTFLYLVKTVYPNLPANHDPFWESLHSFSDEIAYSLTAGLSLGLAYHLGVDATFDSEGTYVGMPEMPQEGHAAFAMANAVTEGLHAGKKMRDGRYVFIEPEFPTWNEAAEYAKKHPGAVVVRGEDNFRMKVRDY